MALFFFMHRNGKRADAHAVRAVEAQRNPRFGRLPLPAKIILSAVLLFLIARSYFAFIIALMIPFGFVFDPLRFTLLCFLYAGYFFMVRRGYFKARRVSWLRHFCAIWMIGFLSAFHMYFFGDLSQCPAETKAVSAEATPVLTRAVCDRSRNNVKEWNECRDVIGTAHTLFADAVTHNIFLPLMGSGRQYPLCVFNPAQPEKRRRISVHGSVHHFGVDAKRRLLFLPTMSDNRVLVVSMDSLRVLDVLRPTVKSSLIDIVVDDAREEVFVLSEYSEVIRISLKSGKTKRLNLKKYSRGSMYALALNRKTRMLYVSSWVGGDVLMMDAGMLKMKKIWRGGFSAMGLQVDEKNNRVFVAQPLFSRITELDGKTLKEVRRYPAGLGVRDIAYLENAGLLMAGNYLRRTVDFIRLSTGKKIRSYYAGPMVRGVYYDAEHRQAYSVGRCGIFRYDVSLLGRMTP